jgi:hypothetical protein
VYKKEIYIGGFIALGFFIAYNYKQKKKTPKVYVRKILGNYNARTIPPFGIYVSAEQKDNKKILEHEMEHWKQYQRDGLLGFMFKYAKENIFNGYDGNKYEIEARKNTGESIYCQKNYTECVRNGLAKTIYNKNFRK